MKNICEATKCYGTSIYKFLIAFYFSDNYLNAYCNDNKVMNYKYVQRVKCLTFNRRNECLVFKIRHVENRYQVHIL